MAKVPFKEIYKPQQRAAFTDVYTQTPEALKIGVSPAHEDFAKKIIELRKNPLVNTLLAAGQGLGESVENITKTIQQKAAIPEKYRKELIAGGLPLGPEWQPPGISEMQLARPTTAAKIAETVGKIPAYAAATAAIPEEAIPEAMGVLPGLAKRIIPAVERFGAGGALAGAFETPKAPVIGGIAGTAGALTGEAAMGAVVGAPAFTKRLVQSGLRKGFSKEMFPYFKDRINTILNDLRGSSSAETSNRDVFNNVSRHYSEKEGFPKDIYGNEINEKTAQFTPPSQSVANDYAQATALSRDIPYDFKEKPIRNALIGEMKKASGKMGQYKESPLFRKDAEDTMDTLRNIRNARLDSFSDADSLKRDINKRIYDTPDVSSTEKDALYNLKNGLQKSIQSTYKQDPGLYRIWRQADTRHATEIMPFRETKPGFESPFMKMQKKGGVDVDKFVSSYIKPKSPDLLNNFMKILPDDSTRKLAAYDYLNQSGKVVAEDNPEAVIKQAKNLTSSQLKTLMPDHVDEIKEMIRLQKKVPRAFRTPKEEVGIIGRAAHLITPALTGAAAYGVTRDIPLAAAAMGAPALARTGIRKLLRTPAGRRFFMKEFGPKAQSILARLRPAARGAGALTALSQFGGQQ